MNILLFRPDSQVRKVSPPIGLMYIGAWLREKLIGANIKIIDGRKDMLRSDNIGSILKEYKPDIIGISSMNIESQQAHIFAGVARKLYPSCCIVMGGAYSTVNPEYILEDKNINFAVIGEGERVMERLIKSISSGYRISMIDGLCLRKNGRIVINRPVEFIEDLDSIPFPSWDLIDTEAYFKYYRSTGAHIFGFHRRCVPILTSRGCHFSCTYCLKIFGKEVRYRSAENIVSEINFLVKKYKIEEIEIRDDIFNMDQRRMIDICSYIKDRGLKITFSNGLMTDFMNEGIINKLKEAGTHKVSYTIPPISSRIQALINKNFDAAHAQKIIDLTEKKGICAEGFFVIGFPGETKKEIQATINYAKNTRLHLANFIYGKSLFFDEGAIKNFELSHFSKKQIFEPNRYFCDDSIPINKELKILMLKAYIEFYLNPIRIWRIFKITNFNILRLIINFFAAGKHIFKSNFDK